MIFRTASTVGMDDGFIARMMHYKVLLRKREINPKKGLTLDPDKGTVWAIKTRRPDQMNAPNTPFTVRRSDLYEVQVGGGRVALTTSLSGADRLATALNGALHSWADRGYILADDGSARGASIGGAHAGGRVFRSKDLATKLAAILDRAKNVAAGSLGSGADAVLHAYTGALRSEFEYLLGAVES